MTLLEDTRARAHPSERGRPSEAHDATPIDLTEAPHEIDTQPTEDAPEPERAETIAAVRRGPVVDPSGAMPWRGMRIRRVRLGSVAKLALVFHTLGFAVVVGTLVVVWNVAQAFGFVTTIEDTVVTSLGVETFDIDGSALFGIVLVGAAILSALGWLITVLLAAVYNATCALLGGLAVETGPLQRRRRVFSLRHRGFVTIRS